MMPFEMMAPNMREYETTYGTIIPAQKGGVLPQVHHHVRHCPHACFSEHSESSREGEK